jgi:integrase
MSATRRKPKRGYDFDKPASRRDFESDTVLALREMEQWGDWPDSRLKGLFVHIGRNKCVWRYKQQKQINGKRTAAFRTLGYWPEMDIKEAREQALIFAGSVASGTAAPGKRVALKFGPAFERYLDHLKTVAERKNKPARWHHNARKLADAHILPEWRDWSLFDMSQNPRSVAAWHSKLARSIPTSAGHCIRLVRACYNMERRLDRTLPADLPTSGVQLGRIIVAEKAMAFDQFPAWAEAWHKIENQTLRGFHLCNLLTGARPGELSLVRKEDFDPVAHVLTIRKSKSGKDIRIPTTWQIEHAIGLALDAPPQMIQMKGLRGMKRGQIRVVALPRHSEVLPDLLFPGCRQAPARSTLPAAGHRLRHTFKTVSAACGVSDTLSAILLGHALPGISGRYVGELALARSDELRQAQQRISDRLFELLGLDLKPPAAKLTRRLRIAS